MTSTHVEIKAPHIEPPLQEFQALVKDIHGKQETVHPFATSPVGASQIVHFFMPNRMLVQLTPITSDATKDTVQGAEKSTTTTRLKGDCEDPVAGAMLKLAYSNPANKKPEGE